MSGEKRKEREKRTCNSEWQSSDDDDDDVNSFLSFHLTKSSREYSVQLWIELNII